MPIEYLHPLLGLVFLVLWLVIGQISLREAPPRTPSEGRPRGWHVGHRSRAAKQGLDAPLPSSHS